MNHLPDLLSLPIPPNAFDGKTFIAEFDLKRLSGQLQNVYRLMQDGVWRTHDEIAAIVQAPTQSISARLRDLRKTKFGNHKIERRARGQRGHGLFEYRLTYVVR